MTEDFDPIRNLSNTAALSNQVQVEVSGSDVYVAWVDRATGDGDVYFRVSHDEGRNFKEAVNLSRSPSTAFAPRLAKSGSTVYVTWFESGPLLEDGVQFAVSQNRGDDFSPTRRIGGRPGGRPEISAAGDFFYAVFPEVADFTPDDEDGLIQFVASRNRGSGFLDMENLNDNLRFGNVDIAAAGGNVYVIWDESISANAPAVRFRSSTDNGSTFGPILTLSEDGTASNRHPQLAAVDDNVYAVWSRCVPGSSCDIIFRRSTDEGSTFRPRANLSNNSGESFRPRIDATGGNVYVVWTDTTPGNQDIFFRRSTDRGSSFSSIRNLSNNKGRSEGPKLSSVSDFVRVVWHDDTPGNNDILYRASDDRGGSFEGTRNLSANPGDSNFAELISSGGGEEVHVVWLDNTPGNADVFYRRGELDD